MKTTRGEFPRSDLALKLREVDGLEYSQIAQQMSTSKSNVSVLICQARKRRDQERLRAAALATTMGANV
jgi:DNA-directed RNA polymerase specialized sigma24 family protein